jgi:N-acetylglucosamine-6-phosphate deacetylase
MTEFLIHNAKIVRPGVSIATGYLHVRAGRIIQLGEGSGCPDVDCPIIDARGQTLTPGLIDMHCHGIHSFQYDQGAEHLRAAASVLGCYGTTTVVPTLVPKLQNGAPKLQDKFLHVLDQFANAMAEVKNVAIPGVHLEGPFVALSGAACATSVGDLGLLEELLGACKGRVSVMSIAPEVRGVIPIIERLVEKGVVPFITNTRASVEQTTAAIDAGASHATHFYDVFPLPEETDPGVRPAGAVETILGDRRGTCDFICDGIHVHPMAVRAAVAAKGWRGVALITDASFGAGLMPGVFETPWGYRVEVKEGNAPRIADPEHPMCGALAGSALTMNRGMENLFRWLDLPEEQIWALGTWTPANILGVASKGDLATGMDADLVLWRNGNNGLEPDRTWVAGEVVYPPLRDFLSAKDQSRS